MDCHWCSQNSLNMKFSSAIERKDMYLLCNWPVTRPRKCICNTVKGLKQDRRPVVLQRFVTRQKTWIFVLLLQTKDYEKWCPPRNCKSVSCNCTTKSRVSVYTCAKCSCSISVWTWEHHIFCLWEEEKIKMGLAHDHGLTSSLSLFVILPRHLTWILLNMNPHYEFSLYKFQTSRKSHEH